MRHDHRSLQSDAAALRRFSRFYTRRLELLGERLLGSGFSLTQSRLLWELAHRSRPTPGELARALALDAGYVSRQLTALQRNGLLRKEPSSDDRRSSVLALTRAGRTAIERLEPASQRQAEATLAGVPAPQRRALVDAMDRIEQLLDPTEAADEVARAGVPRGAPAAWLLRPPRAGDLGHVVARHGELYATEYGWDITFEALVAEIVAKFVRDFDAQRDCCWIAERAGERVGSVFLVRQSARVGKLRLLYVEPSARGLGIGARLVEECIAQARRVGYRRLTLWTNDVLVSARRIYQAAGFELVSSEPHHSFGKDLTGEYWSLDLAAGRAAPRQSPAVHA